MVLTDVNDIFPLCGQWQRIQTDNTVFQMKIGVLLYCEKCPSVGAVKSLGLHLQIANKS